MTELSIAIAVTVFTALLDRRDRMVFLLHLREEMRASALAAQNQGLRAQVEMDALTGVANRRGFESTLAAAWRAGLQDGAPVGLVMIDIDHFKKYNDHYGHQGGDACLRQVAQKALRALREGDFIARYGGEEFAVILPGTRLSVALTVAERVRISVEQLNLPQEGVSPATLIELADRRLYEAKRAGRNRVAGADLGFTLSAGAR
jgi:diguanylate cyclase (GGDEF)-like protein